MTGCSAVVVGLEEQFAIVELPERSGSCGNCETPGGCQTGLLGLRSGNRRFRIENRLGVRVGDRVSVVVSDGAVWYAALRSYLIPAVLTIAGAAVAPILMPVVSADAAAVTGAVSGLLVGYAWLRGSESSARSNGSLISLQLETKDGSSSKELS